MTKIALLIGVGDYEPGLNPLPSAVKDIEAIYRVLRHSDIGGFREENIVRLSNPDRQRMEEAIEQLFADRQKNDLVLLFFSGHGIKDDTGKLYLANRKTRKTQQGELIRSTAVAASFIHDSMNRSRSRHQVIILDCCFSGAFAEGLAAKDDGSVDLKTQLGGEGRAVLTSSTSTQYSFEQENADLSIYTRYLIEGIESGAADQDEDGQISVDELHEYAKQKVQETAPAMKPEIYAVKEGFKIHIAHTLVLDPKQQYGKAVEQVVSRGEISDIARVALAAKQHQLGLSPEEALAIETEVLQPSRKYQQNLRQYEQKFIEAILQNYPLTQAARHDLRYLQQVLELKDEDVNDIEARIGARAKTELDGKGERPSEAPMLSSSTSHPSEVDSTPSTLSPSPQAKGVAVPEHSCIQSKIPKIRISRRLAVKVGAIAAVLAIGFPVWQSYLNREARMTLQVAISLQQQGNYEDCIHHAAAITKESALYRKAQSLLGFCQVKQAQQLVQQQQIPGAVALLSQVPVNSVMYANAQTLLNQFSSLLLEQATEKYDLGEQETAFALVDAIPSNSAVYSQAEHKRREWGDAWVKNSDHLNRIREVLKVNDLQGALAELQQITTLYWTKQAHNIILATMNQIIAYEQSVGADAQKIATAQELQATADTLLQEAESEAEQRSQHISAEKPVFPTPSPQVVPDFMPSGFQPPVWLPRPDPWEIPIDPVPQASPVPSPSFSAPLESPDSVPISPSPVPDGLSGNFPLSSPGASDPISEPPPPESAIENPPSVPDIPFDVAPTPLQEQSPNLPSEPPVPSEPSVSPAPSDNISLPDPVVDSASGEATPVVPDATGSSPSGDVLSEPFPSDPSVSDPPSDVPFPDGSVPIDNSVPIDAPVVVPSAEEPAASVEPDIPELAIEPSPEQPAF